MKIGEKRERLITGQQTEKAIKPNTNSWYLRRKRYLCDSKGGGKTQRNLGGRGETPSDGRKKATAVKWSENVGATDQDRRQAASHSTTKNGPVTTNRENA